MKKVVIAIVLVAAVSISGLAALVDHIERMFDLIDEHGALVSQIRLYPDKESHGMTCFKMQAIVDRMERELIAVVEYELSTKLARRTLCFAYEYAMMQAGTDAIRDKDWVQLEAITKFGKWVMSKFKELP